MRREKHTIQCPCEKAKQFPIVLEFDETKLEEANTKELHCPFCQDMLTTELPGKVLDNETGYLLK